MRVGIGFLFLGLFWLAGGLQQAVSHRIEILGARPDFILIVLAAACPFLSRSGAAWTGFIGGFVQGAIAGANMMHYVVSRTVTGALVSMLHDLRLEANPGLAAATGFLATITAQILLMFLAAPPDIVAYLGATMGSAVYNGVLVIPLYLAMSRWLREPRR